jgi:site-specific DNA-methyltransferase (adenine-specific)
VAGDNMTPYYATPTVQIYHCRWEDLREADLLADIDFVWADPPYGQKEDTARHKNGRGQNEQFRSGANARARDFPAVAGDDRPFDPAPILAIDKPMVLWGANRYSQKLPRSASWLVWDKREDVLSDDNGDCELAWSNLGGPIRRFAHLWKGSCRASETGTVHLHPTQKPVELVVWGLMHAMARKKLKPGDQVFDPYMGSSPTIIACERLGFRLIACDLEDLYCRTAVSARLGAVPHPEPAKSLGPLFGG